ncbi:ferrochelatase [Flammeovirga agarivorans]|uniref:Ferrochelatase n=1 Tax=Flammeovirga agarivorans TaxID=2726742 RepID=A0A7X8XX32_9BACT|nr:ferrochelatase [Flammeovirga agarivorans]NLR92675.1 ferrochelatase [Flammeovirga agarivorans]
MKKGVLIVNLGTPDSQKTPDVRKYLREFLMDERVIDIPFYKRWPLVNLIIAPFRAPKSAKEYEKVWTENGSPLLYYGLESKKLLQEALGDEYVVALGMRYQNPSIQSALLELKSKGVNEIVVVPLFPQYASATTGSVTQKVMELVKDWQVVPDVTFIQHYHRHPLFIKTFAELGQKYLRETNYDHVIFSFHGLPERQIIKADIDTCCKLRGESGCVKKAYPKNTFCYRSACFETADLIAQELKLSKDQYSVCFQSRLGKDPWIQPYTEDVIINLAKGGKKSVLAYSPAFVADCLETTVEVGEEYKEVFEENGGEHWQLVESLNDHPQWIECLTDLVKGNQSKVLELQTN